MTNPPTNPATNPATNPPTSPATNPPTNPATKPATCRAGGGARRSSCFPLPTGLTTAAERTFDATVQEHARQLVEHLQRNGGRRLPTGPLHTTADVRDAQFAYERRLLARYEELPPGGLRGLAVLLLVAAAAVGVLAPYTTGLLQAALVGVFVAVDTAGLLLLWRGAPRAAE